MLMRDTGGGAGLLGAKIIAATAPMATSTTRPISIWTLDMDVRFLGLIAHACVQQYQPTAKRFTNLSPHKQNERPEPGPLAEASIFDCAL
jgi:hypothetical protein